MTAAWFAQGVPEVKTLAFLLFVLVSSCSAPEFTDLDGNSIRFEALKGRWIVINYWAIWCHPCREEVPELNRLARSSPDRLTVLGVSFDLPASDELRQQANSLGIEFPILLQDPSRHFGFQRPDVLPTTYLIGPEGGLVASMQGVQSERIILNAMEEKH